jgi:hypothetical protein
MKRNALLLQLKHLLNAVDKLEYSAEQNRKQIAETRLLVANFARALYFAKESPARKAVRKKSAGRKLQS